MKRKARIKLALSGTSTLIAVAAVLLWFLEEASPANLRQFSLWDPSNWGLILAGASSVAAIVFAVWTLFDEFPKDYDEPSDGI